MISMRSTVASYLQRRSLERDRSRLGWRAAPRYSKYLKQCQAQNRVHVQPSPEVMSAVADFKRDGIASFATDRTESVAQRISARMAEKEARGERIWQDANEYGTRNALNDPWLEFPEFEELFTCDLGDFLSAHFGTGFKIYFGLLYRTEHLNDAPLGSQLWHSDGGPGICINVMYYLHSTTPAEGALQALPWTESLELFSEERRLAVNNGLARYGKSKRDQVCAFYAETIDNKYRDKIKQPVGRAGLVVPFLNNTVHRGGYPAAGHTRTAIVFHCYPSDRPTDLSKYRKSGIPKRGSYPVDPSAEF